MNLGFHNREFLESCINSQPLTEDPELSSHVDIHTIIITGKQVEMAQSVSMTGVQFPAGVMMEFFFSSPPRPDRLWGPPSLPSNGYSGLLP
jgi:hypothetical protein